MGCNCGTKCTSTGVNVGVPDRVIRGGLAGVLVAVGLGQRGAARVIILGLAGMLGSTAPTGRCHLYDVIGVSTAGDGECGAGCACGSDESGSGCCGDQSGSGCCGHEH